MKYDHLLRWGMPWSGKPLTGWWLGPASCPAPRRAGAGGRCCKPTSWRLHYYCTLLLRALLLRAQWWCKRPKNTAGNKAPPSPPQPQLERGGAGVKKKKTGSESKSSSERVFQSFWAEEGPRNTIQGETSAPGWLLGDF